MQLLVVRHAIAGDRDEFAADGRPDSERPVTPKGAKRMNNGAHGLHEFLPRIDFLASSPFARATATAEVIAEEYGGLPIALTSHLEPSASNEELVDWLLQIGDAEVVAIVGHEPHLSGLVAWLLTGRREHFLEMKKGAACLLDFPGQISPGAGTLIWALAPRQLRALA